MGIGFKSVKLRLQLGEAGKMGLISGCGERTNLAMNLVHSLLRCIRNKYPKGQNKKRMSRSCSDRSVKVQGNSYYVVLVKANESNSLGRLVRSCPLLIDLPVRRRRGQRNANRIPGMVVASRPSLPCSFGHDRFEFFGLNQTTEVSVSSEAARTLTRIVRGTLVKT